MFHLIRSSLYTAASPPSRACAHSQPTLNCLLSPPFPPMSKSAAPSNTHRALGWNCDIVCAKNNIFGGYYQHLDLLTVADVVHDLDLCFSPPGHGDDGGDGSQWRRALIPETESRDANGLVLHLDEQDNTTKIPTPDPGSRTRYRYVLHERACTRHREKHSLQGDLISMLSIHRAQRHLHSIS